MMAHRFTSDNYILGCNSDSLPGYHISDASVLLCIFVETFIGLVYRCIHPDCPKPQKIKTDISVTKISLQDFVIKAYFKVNNSVHLF